jgi:tryptophan synthase alpha chain
MSRIDAAFAATKAEKRPALIPFIMGYDGGKKTTARMLAALAENGADLIEIGIPFSDPMADGVVIQAAGLRALQAGASLKGILELVKQFRASNSKTPIILMGYYNPIYRFGAESFCKAAADAGVDGVIIVDLPPEEEAEITSSLEKYNVNFIRLIAPTSIGERLKKLTATASGFIYYIAVAGITGGRSATREELQTRLAEIRAHTKLPIAVGFGIKTPEQAAALKDVADAVVVGSALVDLAAKAGDPIAAASAFIRELSAALR